MLYHVEPENVSHAKRIARSAIVFAITLMGAFMIHYLWSSQRAFDWEGVLFDAVTAAGACLAFESQRKEYEIEVTDDAISMRGGLSLGNRKVRRGHIRLLRESRGNILREPALRVSEHGATYTFLFGCVSVPTSMRQYDEIKSTAMSWAHIG